jgi:hypothetical protein
LIIISQLAAVLASRLEEITSERDRLEHRITELTDHNRTLANELDDALDLATDHALDTAYERLAVIPDRPHYLTTSASVGVHGTNSFAAPIRHDCSCSHNSTAPGLRKVRIRKFRWHHKRSTDDRGVPSLPGAGGQPGTAERQPHCSMPLKFVSRGRFQYRLPLKKYRRTHVDVTEPKENDRSAM